MNNEALFLFLILLLGLVLCSFLGGNCGSEGFTGKFSGTFVTDKNGEFGDHSNKGRHYNGRNYNARHYSSGRGYDNYNHFSKTSTQLPGGTTFYGQNGGYVVANSNSDGSQTLKVVLAGGQQPIMLTTPAPKASSTTESFTNSGDSSTFYGPDGTEAVVQQGANGQPVVQVQTSSGMYSYTTGDDQSNSSSNSDSMSSSSADSMSSTQYFGSTGYPIQTSGSSLSYQGPSGSSSNLPYRGPNRGADATGASSSNYDYSSSLPQGIPASQIPAGQEDMYILKSEIVPPVCPACPTSTACPRQEKCPPCPACARCPEPAFECKKVPNYNAAAGNDSLPTPVLNDFSSFGM
jgi:hypothetical protein